MSAGTLFLVNPASANGATGRRWPALERAAAALGLRGRALLSERPGQLAQFAREADAKLVVVVGGDGSLNEVVNGLVAAGRSDVELAILPQGTGMDFGRTHGLPRRFEDAVRVAVSGRTRELDAGRVGFHEGERYFANVSSVGMSGAVAERANSMSKAFGGRATFFYALSREFAVWRNTDVTVRLDGAERQGRMHDAVIAIGRYHGGGMLLAPEAAADDGLFDVLLIGDVTKRDFLLTAPKLYRGTHLSHPKTELLRSAYVEIESSVPLPLEADGERAGTTPARYDVVPRALRVRVP